MHWRGQLHSLRLWIRGNVALYQAVEAAEVGTATVGVLGPQVTRLRPARLLSYSALSASRRMASASCKGDKSNATFECVSATALRSQIKELLWSASLPLIE